MYIWNTKKLQAELVSTSASELDMVKYLFGLIVLQWISSMFLLDSGSGGSIYYFTVIIDYVIKGLVLFSVYWVHSKLKAKDFLIRYIALSFIIQFKLLVVSTLAMIVLSVSLWMALSFSIIGMGHASIVYFLFDLVFILLYAWRMWINFQEISGGR